MGSYSSHNGTLTLDRVALAKSAAKFESEWTSLRLYENCPTTGEPEDIVFTALNDAFAAEFGDGVELTPASEDEPFTTLDISTHARDTDSQDAVLAVLAECGAVGSITSEDENGYHQITRLDGTSMAVAPGEVVYPADIEYVPALNETQAAALDKARALLLDTDKPATPDDLRATLTDLVIAIQNQPLIDTADDAAEPIGQ